jgi:carbonic anhydrase
MTPKYKEVFEHNAAWAASKTHHDDQYFSRLAEGQHPDFLFIGCSDSRVHANEVMGLEPGDVFVQRNIANIVSNTDMNVHAVIQYAIEVLDVKHIIVCGHYGCGGIKAAMKPKDMGLLNGWLRNISDVYRLHFDELSLIEDEEARFDRLVEKNVEEQCYNIIKTPYIQERYKKLGYPTVHGWVYDIKTGLLKDLHLNYKEVINKYGTIFDMFPDLQ